MRDQLQQAHVFRLHSIIRTTREFPHCYIEIFGHVRPEEGTSEVAAHVCLNQNDSERTEVGENSGAYKFGKNNF